MTTENGIGVQTRVKTEAQCMEDGPQRQLGNNPEQVQGTNPATTAGQETLNPDAQNPAMNLTVDLHKMTMKSSENLLGEMVQLT